MHTRGRMPYACYSGRRFAGLVVAPPREEPVAHPPSRQAYSPCIRPRAGRARRRVRRGMPGAAMPRSRTLADLLDEMAERQPARELVVDGATRLGYAEASARVRRLARGLYALGVRRGDHVAWLMDNRAEWVLVDFAVTLLGATLVPLSTWSRPRELGYVLNHCDATALVTVDRVMGHDFLGLLAEVGTPGSPALPQLRRVVVMSGEAAGASRAAPTGDVIPFDDLWDLGTGVTDATLEACQRAVSPDDVAYILYTSG